MVNPNILKRSFTRYQKGFTIVELLIVVVVIAILATISIVSYNGITDRARTAKTLSLVRQWNQTIILYQATSSRLPNDWTCLGNDVNDFPAEASASIGLGQCERNFIITNTPPDWTSEFKTVPTAGQTLSTPNLLRANTSLSTGGLDKYTYGSNGYMRGIVYASIFDPAMAPQNKPGAYIFYALKGSDCTIGVQHRLLGNIRICAVKLTSDNYASEIYQP